MGHEKQILSARIHTRLSQEKYEELSAVLRQTRGIKTLSELVRFILENKPINIVTYDNTKDKVMEVLSGIRKELQAIGVNINQATRELHRADIPASKVLQAQEIMGFYQQTEVKVAELLSLISKLADQWSLK